MKLQNNADTVDGNDMCSMTVNKVIDVSKHLT